MITFSKKLITAQLKTGQNFEQAGPGKFAGSGCGLKFSAKNSREKGWQARVKKDRGIPPPESAEKNRT